MYIYIPHLKDTSSKFKSIEARQALVVQADQWPMPFCYLWNKDETNPRFVFHNSLLLVVKFVV